MNWLNYHHLLYFWTVAKEGSVAAATGTLRLSQPTISGQIRLLEENLGEKLFRKVGRGLELTEIGQTVYRYADEIFSLGSELKQVLQGRPSNRPLKFAVGIADVVPKLIAHQLLQPLLQMPEDVYLVCHEGKSRRLISEMVNHELDLVICDAPADAGLPVRVYHHPLNHSKIGIFAAGKNRKLRKGFPNSLNNAPFLYPAQGTAIRRSLDQWFDKYDIHPKPVGEFEDSALLKIFAKGGAGLFAGALNVKNELAQAFGVELVGELKGIQEAYFAISAERKIRHPAILTLFGQAKRGLYRKA